jgi:hypothetical protein
VTPAAQLPRGLEKLVASAQREDDKMGCVGSNAAREICLAHKRRNDPGFIPDGQASRPAAG